MNELISEGNKQKVNTFIMCNIKVIKMKYIVANYAMQHY